MICKRIERNPGFFEILNFSHLLIFQSIFFSPLATIKQKFTLKFLNSQFFEPISEAQLLVLGGLCISCLNFKSFHVRILIRRSSYLCGNWNTSHVVCCHFIGLHVAFSMPCHSQNFTLTVPHLCFTRWFEKLGFCVLPSIKRRRNTV